jgi:hypothetical protein
VPLRDRRWLLCTRALSRDALDEFPDGLAPTPIRDATFCLGDAGARTDTGVTLDAALGGATSE